MVYPSTFLKEPTAYAYKHFTKEASYQVFFIGLRDFRTILVVWREQTAWTGQSPCKLTDVHMSIDGSFDTFLQRLRTEWHKAASWEGIESPENKKWTLVSDYPVINAHDLYLVLRDHAMGRVTSP